VTGEAETEGELLVKAAAAERVLRTGMDATATGALSFTTAKDAVVARREAVRTSLAKSAALVGVDVLDHIIGTLRPQVVHHRLAHGWPQGDVGAETHSDHRAPRRRPSAARPRAASISASVTDAAEEEASRGLIALRALPRARQAARRPSIIQAMVSSDANRGRRRHVRVDGNWKVTVSGVEQHTVERRRRSRRRY